MRLGTWNVYTLHQACCLAQLIQEFDNYRFNALGISEVRWIGGEQLASDGKIVLFFWHVTNKVSELS